MTELLGQLASVEVRRLWPHEAADFTPWLAREENMSKLGVALGLELEAEGTEVAVGPYSADILARDSAGNYIGEFRRSMQHEPGMEVSWCEDVARV